MPDVDEPQQEHVAPSDAMREAMHKFAEVRAYAQQYLTARIDQLKLTARKIAILAVLGIVGLFALGAMVIIALVLLLAGFAGAIGSALGGRMWAGDLIVGAVVLGVFAAGAYVGLGMLNKASLKSTVKKYELAQKQQRDSFGRSSRDRAAGGGQV